MDELRAEIISEFESIIAEAVKKEVVVAVEPLKEEFSHQKETIRDLERSANEHTGLLTSAQMEVAQLKTILETLRKKSEDMEAGSRWNNIQAVSLPEGLEGPRNTKFMADQLKDVLGLQERPGLDRAHRTL